MEKENLIKLLRSSKNPVSKQELIERGFSSDLINELIEEGRIKLYSFHEYVQLVEER